MKTTDNWATPSYLLKQIEHKFGKIDFDPCPLLSNDRNSLINCDWNGNIFINPPYSNVENFLDKGLLELKKGNATRLIYLIIPRTSTKYWNNYVMKYASIIYFIDYRLKFGDSKKDFIKCKTWEYNRRK